MISNDTDSEQDVIICTNTPLKKDPSICAICHEELIEKPCELPCDHRFHTTCYTEYMAYEIHTNNKTTVLCPLCRSVVLQINHEISFTTGNPSIQPLNLSDAYDNGEVFTQPMSTFLIKVGLTWFLIYLIVVISQCSYGKHNFICPKA